MSQRHSESERLYRRRLWLGVWIPFLLVVALIAAGAAIVLLLPTPMQVALVADAMLIALALCPSVVLVFALLLVAIGLAMQLQRWSISARSPLRRLEGMTAAAQQRADRWLGSIDAHVLDWAVRLAPLRSLLTMFDAPPPQAPQQSDDEADS